jgi:uncharacterized membrane protein
MSLLAAADAQSGPMVSDPAGILAMLLASLGLIFWATQHPVLGKLFKVVPALVFCYFIPTTLTTLGVIPESSPLYSWVKAYVLPASLLLLILALDLPGIMRLGPKAVIMLLAGTAGVVIGGPIALLITQAWLPEDIWRGMTALSGSWIGGGANFVALGTVAQASDSMMAMMVVPDVLVASLWMGVLLYMSGRQHEIDRFTGADASAIRSLEERLTAFQKQMTRVPSLADLIMIVAIGFVGSYLAYSGGVELQRIITDAAAHAPKWFNDSIGNVGASTWKYVIITTIGLILSFTPVRKLEGAGASKLGSMMLYLLVACIGAGANFTKIVEHPAVFIMGFVWMFFHIAALMITAWLIRAPIFFVAVGSQSNIGGAASAPVVAAAYHPSLAPVGALLAVAGYVLGTYAGLLCMRLLMMVAGAKM